MTSVVVLNKGEGRPVDDVFEIDASGSTVEATCSAPGNNLVLASAFDLCASNGVQLGLEFIGCGEDALGAAIETADEDFFTALQIHPAWFLLEVEDFRVPAAIQAPVHINRGDSW